MRADPGVSFSSARPYPHYVRRVITILTLMALAAASLPALAVAQGNSGVDEYEEVLPSPGGGGDEGGGDEGGGDEDSTGALTPEQVSALEDAGADGAAAAELSQESSPGGSGGGENSSGDPKNSADSSAADESEGVVDVVGDLASGSDDGMGIALPIVLLVAAVAAVGFVVARRSRGRAGPS